MALEEHRNPFHFEGDFTANVVLCNIENRRLLARDYD